MERPKFTKDQIMSKSGEPGIRYRIEERIDENHKIVLVAHPIAEGEMLTPETIDILRQNLDKPQIKEHK